MRPIPKGFIISIVLVTVCLSVTTTASASSLQLRGGIINGDTGEGTNVGLDLFFYEGRSFDFFVGYDINSASQKNNVTTPTGIVSANTDATTTVLSFGLRYKMQTDSSWKPYVSFGFTRLNTKFTHQPGMESYFEKPFERSTSGILLGLGLNVGISDKWSLGMEATMLTDVPYYEYSYFSMGSAGLSITDYGTISQVDIALRYHFD